MGNSIRDVVVNALTEYSLSRWGAGGEFERTADDESAAREQAKEMADVVFDTLSITPQQQDAGSAEVILRATRS